MHQEMRGWRLSGYLTQQDVKFYSTLLTVPIIAQVVVVVF